jgi:hypothetical protein
MKTAPISSSGCGRALGAVAADNDDEDDDVEDHEEDDNEDEDDDGDDGHDRSAAALDPDGASNANHQLAAASTVSSQKRNGNVLF